MYVKILITGSYSGIGYRLGCALAKKGHTVYMGVENKKQEENIKVKLRRDMIDANVIKLDITTSDIEKVDDLDLDCLINHAGIGVGGSILYMDIDDLRKNFEVNFFSSFELLKRVYKSMIRNKKNGKIFVTSSVTAYLPFPFLGCYTSSKAAISMLCRSIKMELDYLNNGISISIIEPGAYHTGFNQRMIDNKNIYLFKSSPFYKERESINRLQNNLFRLIEKDDYSDLINKVVKEIEKKKPKFIIRRPWYMSFLVKLYFLIFG